MKIYFDTFDDTYHVDHAMISKASSLRHSFSRKKRARGVYSACGFCLLLAGIFLPAPAFSQEDVFVDLALGDKSIDAVVVDENPSGGLPQTFPYVSGLNEGSHVSVVAEYPTKQDTLAPGEEKALLIRKIAGHEPFAVLFSFAGSRVGMGKLKLDLKGLFEANGQRGNVIIGFSDDKGLVSYIQIGDGGVVQLIQTGKEQGVLDFEPVPMGRVVDSLALEVNYETAMATVIVNGISIGSGTFDSDRMISALTLNIGGNSDAQRALAIEKLCVTCAP